MYWGSSVHLNEDHEQGRHAPLFCLSFTVWNCSYLDYPHPGGIKPQVLKPFTMETIHGVKRLSFNQLLDLLRPVITRSQLHNDTHAAVLFSRRAALLAPLRHFAAAAAAAAGIGHRQSHTNSHISVESQAMANPLLRVHTICHISSDGKPFCSQTRLVRLNQIRARLLPPRY